MKPSAFDEANSLYGEDSEYLPLPALVVPTDAPGINVITSCWQLSWRERFNAFFRGRVFAHVIGRDPQPLLLTTTINFEEPK